MAVLEAMAQGVPVVATAVGGLPEFVIEGETGLLHEHRDDAGLAGQILRLLHDPRLAARLGAAGRLLIATKFSRQRTLDDMTALYHRMLSGRRRAAPDGRYAGTNAGRQPVGGVPKGGD